MGSAFSSHARRRYVDINFWSHSAVRIDPALRFIGYNVLVKSVVFSFFLPADLVRSVVTCVGTNVA